jgi:hypothetical protein
MLGKAFGRVSYAKMWNKCHLYPFLFSGTYLSYGWYLICVSHVGSR